MKIHYYGFTLVEILIVIVILSVLILLLSSKVSGYADMAGDVERKNKVTMGILCFWQYQGRTGILPDVPLCLDELEENNDELLEYCDIRFSTYESGLGVDECAGPYKYIPFSDRQGGFILTRVERQVNATFKYGAGVESLHSTLYPSLQCQNTTCGNPPWYYAELVQ